MRWKEEKIKWQPRNKNLWENSHLDQIFTGQMWKLYFLLYSFLSVYGWLGKLKSFYFVWWCWSGILQYSMEIDMRLFAFAIWCGQVLPLHVGEWQEAKETLHTKQNNESANNIPLTELRLVLHTRIHKTVSF